jgi:hypothetical protein
VPELLAARGEAAGGAVDQIRGARGSGASDGLPRGADGEVVPQIAVEVARRERPPEAVAALGDLADSGRVLMPDLTTGRGEAARGAVDHVGRSGVADRADALERNARCEVGPRIAVQVPGGERLAEAITGLGDLADPGAVLAPELISGG